jgi:translation initiation factor 1
MDKNSELVYSTDPERNQKCPKCKKLKIACVCSADKPAPAKVTAVLRIEKAGRGGKTVTVIDRLPNQESYLEKLAKTLKTKCGAGGTYLWDGPFGQIEIQGDKRDLIRSILIKEGIQCKG